MLTALTAAQLDHGLAAIALAQRLGELPPGPVSIRTLAAYSGLSPSTIAKYETLAIARAYQNATALGIQSPARILQTEN